MALAHDEGALTRRAPVTTPEVASASATSAASRNALMINCLSRDQVEHEQAIRRLESWGIRIVTVSDGYDSRRVPATVQ